MDPIVKVLDSFQDENFEKEQGALTEALGERLLRSTEAKVFMSRTAGVMMAAILKGDIIEVITRAAMLVNFGYALRIEEEKQDQN